MTESTSLTGAARRFADIDDTADFGMIIDGKSVPSESGRTFRLFDPFEEAEWASVPEASAADVDCAVKAARSAFETWSRTPVMVRSKILSDWASLIREHTEELARLQVHENGKTITEMRGATPLVSMMADYAAQLIHTLHGDVLTPMLPGHDAWTRKEPIGGVAAITPWNNPLVLLSWKLVPAIAAGNTIVIKPSEVTPVSTLRLVELAAEAGMPAGVINVITGHGAAGAALVEHPGIDKVAFTWPSETGRRIAETAARRFLRTTLELGGKGPQIVFPEADLGRAVDSLLTGVIAGTGQACNAGSRLLIHDSIYDEVVERLVTSFSAVPLGDPLDDKTAVGPLASRAHFEKVTSYLRVAEDEDGTDLVVGGRAGTDVPGVERVCSWSPPCSRRPTGTRASAARRSSDRSARSSGSRTKPTLSASRTTRRSGSWPASGPRTSSARDGCPRRCAREWSGSTRGGPSASMRPSAVSRPAASGVNWASRCSTSTPRPRRSGTVTDRSTPCRRRCHRHEAAPPCTGSGTRGAQVGALSSGLPGTAEDATGLEAREMHPKPYSPQFPVRATIAHGSVAPRLGRHRPPSLSRLPSIAAGSTWRPRTEWPDPRCPRLGTTSALGCAQHHRAA
jgi:aldehyde dehydrogenase (NAD+)